MKSHPTDSFFARFHWGALGLAIALPIAFSPLQGLSQTAAEIQAQARYSQTQAEVTLKGRLQTSRPKRKVDFTLELKKGLIRFAFASGAVLEIDRRAGNTKISQIIDGKASAVAPGAFGESVQGTDATYEDLAMRFLDWPTATIAGTKLLKGRDTWHLDIPSPTDLKVRSPYSRVYAYIDKASGGLLRVDAFDWEGRASKTYEVVSGQKVGDQWFLKKMRIQSIDPASGTVKGTTTLRFVVPKK